MSCKFSSQTKLLSDFFRQSSLLINFRRQKFRHRYRDENNIIFAKRQESPAVADKPRDAKAYQKLLQFDVKTSCRQVNDLFEVMELTKYRFFEVSEFGHYTACCQQW